MKDKTGMENEENEEALRKRIKDLEKIAKRPLAYDIWSFFCLIPPALILFSLLLNSTSIDIVGILWLSGLILYISGIILMWRYYKKGLYVFIVGLTISFIYILLTSPLGWENTKAKIYLLVSHIISLFVFLNYKKYLKGNLKINIKDLLPNKVFIFSVIILLSSAAFYFICYQNYYYEYWDNGKVRVEGRYQDGNKKIKEGLWKYYDVDGLIEAENNYENGKLNGLATTYSSGGALQDEANYKNGKLNGSYKVYYDKGNIKEEGKYVNDKNEGIVKYYYENGVLKNEAYWKNGIQNGLSVFYDKEGKKIKESTVVNNKYEGKQTEWWSNGKIKVERIYKNDKILSEEWYPKSTQKISKNEAFVLDSNLLDKPLKEETLRKEVQQINENLSAAIIIGSFGAIANAEKLKKSLIDEGFENIDISKVGNVNRVSILISGSKEDAQEVLKKVKVNHKSAWISYK